MITKWLNKHDEVAIEVAMVIFAIIGLLGLSGIIVGFVHILH